jgi:hypothetical protein
MNSNKFEIGDLVWDRASSRGNKTPTWIGLVSETHAADHILPSFGDPTKVDIRLYYVYRISWLDNRRESWIPEHDLEKIE